MCLDSQFRVLVYLQDDSRKRLDLTFNPEDDYYVNEVVSIVDNFLEKV